MAAFDVAENHVATQLEEEGIVIDDLVHKIIAMLRKEYGDEIWELYREHEDDVIVNVLGGIIKKRVKDVKQIKALIEKIAGPEPF